eukprot:4582818-Prorocentrum_lima.AAC.1
MCIRDSNLPQLLATVLCNSHWPLAAPEALQPGGPMAPWTTGLEVLPAASGHGLPPEGGWGVWGVAAVPWHHH